MEIYNIDFHLPLLDLAQKEHALSAFFVLDNFLVTLIINLMYSSQ